MDPADTSYHIPGWIAIKEAVQIEALKKTLTGVIRRHESFRTGIKKVDNQPVQFIRDYVEIPIQEIDISGQSGEEKQQKTQEIISRMIRRPFDLETPPLFRSLLIKLGAESFIFVYIIPYVHAFVRFLI